MSSLIDIQSGQKFRAVDGILWAVDGLARTTDHLPHVKLVGITDPTAIKVIALNALLDRRLYNEVDHRLHA